VKRFAYMTGHTQLEEKEGRRTGSHLPLPQETRWSDGISYYFISVDIKVKTLFSN
jgi:hypothetical protein